MGAEWEYRNDEDREMVQTMGPLRHGITILVSSLKTREPCDSELCTLYLIYSISKGINFKDESQI